MKKNFTLIFLLVSSFSLFAQKKPATAKPAAVKPIFKNSADSFSYAIGMAIAGNLQQQGVTTVNGALLQRGMQDVFGNKSQSLTPEQANMTIQQKLQEYMAKKLEAAKVKDLAFLDANKKRKEVTTLPDGLQYEVIQAAPEGTLKPGPEDTVVVHYIGSLLDGTEFNNSYKMGKPAVFTVNRVIAAWSEALQLMRVGDKWRIYAPTELAYNMNPPTPAIPPGAALVFDISLEGIKPVSK